MKSNIKRSSLFSTIITSILFVFIAFSQALAADVQTIYVGTQPDYPPVCYRDDSGKVTGYEIELLRKIFEKLPEYNVEFLPTSWDGVLLGINTGKTQIIADSVAWTEERNQKYYLSKGIYDSASYIIVKKGRTDIKSLEDLKGKTLEAVVGVSQTALIEKWNEANGKKIDIKYTNSANYTDPLSNVANGRVDAYVEDIVNLNYILKTKNFEGIEIVGEPISSEVNVFAYRRDELGETLKTKIDKVIDELKADGTIQSLAVEWLGTADLVPK